MYNDYQNIFLKTHCADYGFKTVYLSSKEPAVREFSFLITRSLWIFIMCACMFDLSVNVFGQISQVTLTPS